MKKNIVPNWTLPTLSFAGLVVFVILAASVPSVWAAPASVAIAGSMQSELGCPGDWQPECANSELIEQGNDVWRGAFTIPAGDYAYKAALNDTWDEAYPAGDVPLSIAADQEVRFYYDDKTKVVIDNVNLAKIPVAAGSFQSEVGCPGDWQPECVQTLLTDADGDGIYTFSTAALPVGSYAFKVAFNEGWGNGEVPAGDVPFDVTSAGQGVVLSWNSANDEVGVQLSGSVDLSLVADVIQEPIQDEIFYFVLPDRFSDGDPTNNEGAAPGGALADTGYLIDDKAFYHGGDFAGLAGQLDYLENLGVTALWITPPFENLPTQPDSSTAFGFGAAYHGYWILNFEKADPHLGTDAELISLIDDAHTRGMKVYFDIVVNHTADVLAYDGGSTAYRSKSDFPYRDASGVEFDDRDYAGTGTFPALDPAVSFPYTPVFPNPGDDTAKTPAWLNDPIYYHNRGDSSFSGENSLYGDFFGLDDLFTEHPDVVNGFIDIFKNTIDTYDVDGFRIDTVKHVNDELWQTLAPEVLAYAEAQGKTEFSMFGEVFDGNPAFLSEFTTDLPLPSVLDFGLQGNATAFAAQSNNTDNLRNFFAQDDYYIDADSNAYQLANFISNHDIGRVGKAIQDSNGGASDAELVDRMELAHALMYFSRGFPVVYYGDEQGFTGDGGDKDARQDMMPSQVASYNDDNLIGTTATTADSNFDQTHVLYQSYADFAALREAHVALRRGAQIHRFSTGSAGVYAFSRIDSGELVEYVVLLNNAESTQSATFETYVKSGSFTEIYPGTTNTAATDANGQMTVDVPALGVVVMRADAALAADSAAAPQPSFTNPLPGGSLNGNVEVAVDLSASDRPVEVTFAAKVGTGSWEILGTDNNAPYRVFYDVSDLPVGTTVAFQAVVKDLVSGEVAGTATDGVTADESSVPAEYVIIHYYRPDGDYGDWTSDDFNDFWGLHLWGSALHPDEYNPDWPTPRKFSGIDEYGAYVAMRLEDPSQPVNFIIHKGNEKDTDPDRSFDPSVTPEIWIVSGDETNYASQAEALQQTVVHYNRAAGDYGDPTSSNYNDFWGLHLWQDGGALTEWTAPKPFEEVDDYGAKYIIDSVEFPALDLSSTLNFIVHRGDTKNVNPDQSYEPSENYEIWLKEAEETIYTQRGAADNVATIHYARCLGDYGDYTSSDYNDFWGLHTWGGAEDPGWTTPRKPAGQDDFGVYFEVPLFDGAEALNYIFHRGDTKDVNPDQSLDLTTTGYEIWIVEGAGGANEISAEKQFTSVAVAMNVFERVCAGTQVGNINEQRAFWLAADTIGWIPKPGSAASYKLFAAPEGGMALEADVVGGTGYDLTVDPAGLDSAITDKFPHLAGQIALKLDAADLALVPDLLKGQVVVAAYDAGGAMIDATGLQIPGVLDDLYIYDGDLGTVWNRRKPTLKVWAPTAKSVTLHLFDDSDPATESVTYPMTWDAATGVWSVEGKRQWDGKYYLYEVEVYVPSTGQVENNLVTDPYSLSLSENSARTQIVRMNSSALRPRGWNSIRKPGMTPEDITVYELHIRDFSIFDESVAEVDRGKYTAFTYDGQRGRPGPSYGMTHLMELADAGLTHIHLLPPFDIATINENAAERVEPDPAVLASYVANSEEQQALINTLRDQDGFNWGYDPFHYGVPEGSYSTNPDGAQRVVEFRQMVQTLAQNDLRVVVDVVYNHTSDSGQSQKSVLDRIVPGYYHRLNASGQVETSTCCQNTATEHEMMEKLMIDTVIMWAKYYKIDAFRFDLMGHHMKEDMLSLRAALDELTLWQDGVDGTGIYLYGEGWNFGEVANNARGENATQLNMTGTGIGTFSDRMRDAVRGPGPFNDGEDLLVQGFGSGLCYDLNSLPQADACDRLLLLQDQIMVEMAGNLAEYEIVDRNGNVVTGAEVDYNGQPSGYTADPQENISYISKHDNQTLFDIYIYGMPTDTPMDERVRAQHTAITTVALGQGIPFFHAGVDMLRSKSLDRNSYNSGDWFNVLDFTYGSNNYGVGLPPAEGGQSDNWPIMGPLLIDPNLYPSQADIEFSVELFKEWLEIRYSSPLFRLQTAEEVNQRVSFYNNGPDALPGVIVMHMSDEVAGLPELDSQFDEIVVVINANDEAQTVTVPEMAGEFFVLHDVQRNSVDSVVQGAVYQPGTSTFVVPARTTAVYVVKDRFSWYERLFGR